MYRKVSLEVCLKLIVYINYRIIMLDLKLIFKPFYHFFAYYVTNYIIAFIPLRSVRIIWYKCILRIKIGKKSFIDMGTYFLAPWRLSVGNYTHINRRCFIDSRARGGVKIGSCVSISHNVSIVSASHDVNDKYFSPTEGEVVIGDFVFIGINAIILKSVHIGKGAVICAGAVVTKNVEPYAIVAGVPARLIGYRIKDLDYKCNPKTFFF